MQSITQTERELGALQHDFRNQTRFIWGGIVISAFFFLLAACGVVLLMIDDQALNRDKGLPIIYWVLPSSLVWLAFGVYILWKALQLRGARLQIFENGLLYSRKNKTQVFTWKSIEQFWASMTVTNVAAIPIRTDFKCKLKKADGENLDLTSGMFKEMKQVTVRIGEETFKNLWPRITAAIDQGETVNFGKFNLSRDGIFKKNKRIAWAEIKSIEIEQGFIKIKKHNSRFNWMRVAWNAVPNAHVFFAFAQQMINKDAQNEWLTSQNWN